MRLKAEIAKRLAATRGFVFDLDGTLVLGDKHNKGLRTLPGAVRMLEDLNRRRFPYAILTNGTVRPPHELAGKLRDAGLPIEGDCVVTPSSVAGESLAREGCRTVLALGGEGVIRPLADAGLEVVTPAKLGRRKVDAVFAGWFREFTMSDLEAACTAVERGATLGTASMSLYFATAGGKAIGTSRAICAMVTSVTGARPRIFGKPSLAALRSASRKLGIATRHLAVLGDDPTLEVEMAHRGRALAIGVRSGVAGTSEFDKMPRDRRAHILVHNVGELHRLYLQSLGNQKP
ncbi:MAG TPA: HAD family hydrolase [Steroidobacteraceae bacterium]|nr:HAD family hydrolase [Steroidobacteraceae bacterium]